MTELLILLLPLAFYSGFLLAKKRYKVSGEERIGISKYFLDGVNFLLREQPKKALDLFVKYPSIDSNTAKTYQILGNVFRSRGEFDRAIALHENLISRPNLSSQDQAEAMLELGRDHMSAGMLDRALNLFQELRNSEHLPKALREKACDPLRQIYEQLNLWDKAIEVCGCSSMDVPQRNKHIAHYHCELALAQLQQGQMQIARESAERAQKFHPDFARSHYILALIEAKNHQYEASLQHMVNALKAAPVVAQGYFDEIRSTYDEQLPQLREILWQQFDQQDDEHSLMALAQIEQWLRGDAAMQDKLQQAIASRPSLSVGLLDKVNHSHEALGLSLQQLHHTNQNSISHYLQQTADHQCQNCGYQTQQFLWRCPACLTWDSFNQ